jgi:hypothetical protein
MLVFTFVSFAKAATALQREWSWLRFLNSRDEPTARAR